MSLYNLPVIWKSNTISWMTSTIMKEWFNNFDMKMLNKNDHFNVGFHPNDVSLKNITILFFVLHLTKVLWITQNRTLKLKLIVYIINGQFSIWFSTIISITSNVWGYQTGSKKLCPSAGLRHHNLENVDQ